MAPTPADAPADAFAPMELDGRPVPMRLAPIEAAAPAPKPAPPPALAVDFDAVDLLAEDAPAVPFEAPPSDTEADAPWLGLVPLEADVEVDLLPADEDGLDAAVPRPLRSEGESMPPRPE